jgi:hypothetical protein
MPRSAPLHLVLLLLLAVPAAAGAAPSSARTERSPAAAAASNAGAAFVARFGSDPLAGSIFLPEGDAVSRFTWIGKERPHFAGDRPGTLRVLYDTTVPTGRLSAPLGTVLSTDGDFEFGAVLTIRSAGFHADPEGFSQIAFGLWNAHTTGLGRTLFPSDSYDLVEADYFANVTEFGGPFLSPTVFGGEVGGNAFFNFAFQSAETALPFDTPLLIQGKYDAASERLIVSVSRYAAAATFTPIPGARTEVDLSHLAPAFLADVVGIAGYGEGWPSLRAEVDYDLLYVGALPPPFRVTANPPGRTRTQDPGLLLRGRLGRLRLDRFYVQDDLDVLAQ